MLRERVITALILAALVLLVIFLLPHVATMAALALLVVAAAWEWSAFPRFTQHSARIFYVAFVAACVAATWWFGVEREEMDRLIQMALLWWVFALVWVAVAPARVNRTTAAGAGLLVLVPAWLALARLHAAGPQLLLFLILLVVAADVGAYFAGRRFGHNKLAPRVSPGKTWEGVLGAFVAAALLAAVGVWWLRVDAPRFFALCLIVVVASIIGDLTESLFKRHAGLKDSGTLLPGHGGLLDRVDSVTAAAPVFLIGLERLGLLR
ncbi:MAG: phosphatidate cytidylyltransferase [Steroidobacteraceae bacterium]